MPPVAAAHEVVRKGAEPAVGAGLRFGRVEVSPERSESSNGRAALDSMLMTLRSLIGFATGAAIGTTIAILGGELVVEAILPDGASSVREVIGAMVGLVTALVGGFLVVWFDARAGSGFFYGVRLKLKPVSARADVRLVKSMRFRTSLHERPAVKDAVERAVGLSFHIDSTRLVARPESDVCTEVELAFNLADEGYLAQRKIDPETSRDLVQSFVITLKARGQSIRGVDEVLEKLHVRAEEITRRLRVDVSTSPSVVFTTCGQYNRKGAQEALRHLDPKGETGVAAMRDSVRYEVPAGRPRWKLVGQVLRASA